MTRFTFGGDNDEITKHVKKMAVLVLSIVIALFIFYFCVWLLAKYVFNKSGFSNYPFYHAAPWSGMSALPGAFLSDQVAFGATAAYTDNDGVYQFAKHPVVSGSAAPATPAKEGMCGKASFTPTMKSWACEQSPPLSFSSSEDKLVQAMNGDS